MSEKKDLSHVIIHIKMRVQTIVVFPHTVRLPIPPPLYS